MFGNGPSTFEVVMGNRNDLQNGEFPRIAPDVNSSQARTATPPHLKIDSQAWK